MKYLRNLITALTIVGTGIAVAEELPQSSTSSAKSDVMSDDEGLPVLADPLRSNIDLHAGASYLYDSNVTQLADGEGGFVGVADFGVDYGYGEESGRGAYYGLSYLGQVFVYDDADTRAGRDSLEHQVGAYVGLTGGRTRFRLDSTIYFNNGNGIDLQSYDREVRRASSTDYAVDATIVRELPHGSLELGSGVTIRDFEGGTGLNDGESYYGDLAWFYQPGFAPKSAFGLGVRGGQDDFDGNGTQDFITPSFRWRYMLSGKTSLHATTGYEFRSIDGGNDSESFVYDLGATWDATAKTSLGISSYRNVQPSFVSAGQNYTATGVALVLNQELPAHFSLVSSAGYEVAGYESTEDGVVVNRDDDYLKAGLSLGRQISLLDHLDGSVSLFYNYSQNESSQSLVEFDQHVTGVRVGLNY